MVHTSLEDHLEEVCPKCGKEHESNWTLEIDARRHYLKLTCTNCSYIVFKKIDFIAHDLSHVPT